MPKINKPKKTDDSKADSGKKINKHEQLYQHGLLKHAQKKESLDPDVIEFNKNAEAYTFMPEIHEINYSGALKPIISGQLAKIISPRDEK